MGFLMFKCMNCILLVPINMLLFGLWTFTSTNSLQLIGRNNFRVRLDYPSMTESLLEIKALWFWFLVTKFSILGSFLMLILPCRQFCFSIFIWFWSHFKNLPQVIYLACSAKFSLKILLLCAYFYANGCQEFVFVIVLCSEFLTSLLF